MFSLSIPRLNKHTNMLKKSFKKFTEKGGNALKSVFPFSHNVLYSTKTENATFGYLAF